MQESQVIQPVKKQLCNVIWGANSDDVIVMSSDD